MSAEPRIEEMDPVPAAALKPDSLPPPFMMMGDPQQDKLAVTPTAASALDDDDDDDEEADETLSERLWGLTEMFPASVRRVTGSVLSATVTGGSALYRLGKSGLWVVASSAVILALPVMFETERAQMEEQQIQQQRQILLGPNAAVSGGAGMAPGMSPGAMPQVVPPPAPQR